MLNGTIRHHLATYAEVDPEFVKRMIEGFYVDDLVTGERTVDKTFTLYKNAGEQMAKGRFTLKKWKTNDPGLREMISTCESNKRTQEVGRLEDEETHAKSKLEPHGGKKGKKVLGLAWDCEDDTLHFNFQHKADKAMCYMWELYIAVDCWIGLNRVVTSKDTLLWFVWTSGAGSKEFLNSWSINSRIQAKNVQEES